MESAACLIEEVQQESHAYRGGRGFLGLVDDEPLAGGRERQGLAAGREKRSVVPYAPLVHNEGIATHGVIHNHDAVIGGFIEQLAGIFRP